MKNKADRWMASYFSEHLLVSLRRIVRGFLFIPSLMALLGVLLAVAAALLDRSAALDFLFDVMVFLNIDAQGARTVLSTIAGAMMTVISLVYSLTLVVFTLAASNIGPRLLETFTNNRVNQITIGLLGATFLYALIVLYIVGDEEVPKISVAIAIVMAATSFFWLVYFVHDVARRVMIDNEIGRTQRSLRHAIDRLLEAEPPEERDDPGQIPKGKYETVVSKQAGYVTSIDVEALCDAARQSDGFVEMTVQPGSHLIEGSAIARLRQGARSLDPDRVRSAVLVSDARAPEGDIQFTVHLNVEIALRALSPGVNDAYTAISAIDHLSGSLARIMRRGTPSALHVDDDGKPRLWLERMDVKDIVGAALHPLRRASAGNMLVTLKLIDALARMGEVVRSEYCRILTKHLRLIATSARLSVDNPDDRRELAEAIGVARSSLAARTSRTRHDA